ncbi:hypothetical protein PGT21_036248 [Puccinia graminis f. sp. tritici]|uniref:Uncharacterized protein n=1 Tax=Puccinia graminis f. sp. tritici TaxID=56615 RepID=A0A5B0QQG9_PUCGR|nr:hypothetical protein PGT21_036248 [Puccinia graminis f. sp. tritici]
MVSDPKLLQLLAFKFAPQKDKSRARSQKKSSKSTKKGLNNRVGFNSKEINPSGPSPGSNSSINPLEIAPKDILNGDDSTIGHKTLMPASGAFSGSDNLDDQRNSTQEDVFDNDDSMVGQKSMINDSQIDPNLDTASLTDHLMIGEQVPDTPGCGGIIRGAISAAMCSFCDEVLPDNPSGRFVKQNQYLTGLREAKRRFSSKNPQALHLPVSLLLTSGKFHLPHTDP